MRDPETGILPVPSLAQIGIGGVVVVIRIRPAAMAAQEAHIVNQGRGPGAPQHADRARIDAAR